MDDQETTKHFESASELIRYLNIGRPTFYRRAKTLGINTTKGTYTLEELRLLSSPLTADSGPSEDAIKDSETVKELQQQLETANKLVEQQKEQLDVTKQELDNSISNEVAELLKQKAETAESTVTDYKEQLRSKDKQLEQSSKALDQSQRLQSDLQQKLDQTRLQLETVKQNKSEHTEQEDSTVKETDVTAEHRGFWSRLFGGE